jgi:hypothetical protein
LNLGRRGAKPATNRLSYGAAFSEILFSLVFAFFGLRSSFFGGVKLFFPVTVNFLQQMT